MPKRIAAEMCCARCGRVWYADYDPEKKDVETTSLELVVRAPGGKERKISYDALCDTCAKAVAAHIDQIDKLEKASPQRKPRAKKVGSEGTQASPPAPPPPNAMPAAPPAAGAVAAAPSARAAASAHAPSTARGPQSTGPRPA